MDDRGRRGGEERRELGVELPQAEGEDLLMPRADDEVPGCPKDGACRREIPLQRAMRGRVIETGQGPGGSPEHPAEVGEEPRRRPCDLDERCSRAEPDHPSHMLSVLGPRLAGDGGDVRRNGKSSAGQPTHHGQLQFDELARLGRVGHLEHGRAPTVDGHSPVLVSLGVQC